MDTPESMLAEFFDALDPEAIFRAIALSCAENRCSRDKDHNQVMAVASAYFEFIDPFALDEHRVQVTLVKKP